MKKVIRNHEIKVRLSDEELKRLDRKVVKSGLRSRERFCRACFENVVIKELPKKDFFVLITEVKRVGTNLNQVARRLNSYTQNERPDSSEVNNVIQQVYGAVDLIYKTCSNVGDD